MYNFGNIYENEVPVFYNLVYSLRVAAWYFGEPLTKKMVRDWRKQKEQPKTNRPNNQSVRRIVKLLQLE